MQSSSTTGSSDHVNACKADEAAQRSERISDRKSSSSSGRAARASGEPGALTPSIIAASVRRPLRPGRVDQAAR